MKPLVSVIIPIYKVEEFLHECVDSVLQQTYRDIEIILVDDGSPDKCPRICDSYSKLDDRVKVFHKVNGGLSDARNYGLRMATGEYVIFLDSDDLWVSDKAISNIVDVSMMNPDADVIFLQKFSFKDGDRICIPVNYNHLDCSLNGSKKEVMLEHLRARGNYLTSAYTKLIKRAVLVNNGVEFEKGLLSEDYDWSLKLYQVCRNFAFSDEIFYAYRIRKGSITQSKDLKLKEDQKKIIMKWSDELKDVNLDEKEKRIYLDFLSYVYSILLGNINVFDNNQASIFKDIKRYSYLLDYAANPKTKKVAILHKLVGLKLTSIILHIFISIR